MATVIGQVFQAPVRIARKESVILTARAVTTTSNEVINQTSSQYSDPGIVITNTGVGTFSLTFPACPAEVVAKVSVVTLLAGAAPHARLTAFSPTAGTGTITTYAGAPGTATSNASATFEIHLEIIGAIRLGG